MSATTSRRCGVLPFSTPLNTVKPLALMEWLVTLITPPGGTVLDPFAGSGTTLEAARNVGIHATGIELDPEHVQLIHARLNTPTTPEPDTQTAPQPKPQPKSETLF